MQVELDQRIVTAKNFRESRRAFAPGVDPTAIAALGERIHAPEPELEKLKQIEHRLAKDGRLSNGEIGTIISLSPESGPTSVSSLLEQSLGRIRSETGALRDSDEVFLAGSALMVEGKPLAEVVQEVWDHPSEVHGTTVRGGVYLHDEKLIALVAPKPTDAEVLASLATTGTLPEANLFADHERLHAIQLNIAEITPPLELLEAHAYRTMPYTLEDVPFELLVNHVTKDGVYKEIDPRKFQAAVTSVDHLIGLGYSPEQIAKIISNPGAWDNTTDSWKGIDDKISSTLRHFGRGKNIQDDLEFLERRRMMFDLEHAIARQQARIFTQQTLLEAHFQRFKNPIPPDK